MTLAQRLIAFMLLAGAIGAFVIAGLTGETRPIGPQETGSDIIEELIPAPNTEVLRQSPVGIDLAAGYQAELWLNGQRIPDEELNRFRNPDDPRQANPATAANVDIGLNRYVFQPQEDHSITTLNGDENCARAVYWPVADPADRREVRWCFRAA